MSKTLTGFKLPWTLWKRTGAYSNISFSKGVALFSGEISKPPLEVNEDIIYNDLKMATSSTAVLQLINQHHKKMNTKQVVTALKSLFTLQKDDQRSSSLGSLLNHPGFEKLCNRLKVQSGVLDLNDIVDALKIISYVRVPTNSTITQILLQLIRKNINSLNIHQVLFLHFLMNDFRETPLVEALKIALPLVFEIHLPKKMDRRNPAHMAECLVYAIKHELNDETISVILHGLKQFHEEFDAQTAKSLIISLCNMQKRSDVESLYRKCVTDAIVNYDMLNIHDINFTLHKMAQQYKKSHPFYYQEVFFDTAANYCIENKTDISRSTTVLRQLARVHHFHKNLLDYVSTSIYENPYLKCDATDCYSLTVALVLSDYKPVHWDSSKAWIKNAKDLGMENKKEIIWIRFAASLCLLDIYKADVLARSVNKNYIEHLFAKGFMSDYENYFAIWKMIKTYKSDLSDLLPTNFEPKDLIHHFKAPQEYPLEVPLEKCLGGKQYFLTNLYSKLGDIIDYAIVFSKDGYPVKFKEHVKFIEDINLQNDNELVVILALQHYHYTNNTKMLRLSVVKSMEILEDTIPNCHVIPVDVNSWLQLEEYQRIPHLMQKIKEKIYLDVDVLQNAM